MVCMLCLLMAALGAVEGVLITQFLFLVLPSSHRIASTLYVLNVGFCAAYWSSCRMKESILVPYFVFVFAVTSIVVCLWLYGATWLGVLNILGYFMNIAGCVFVGVCISRMRKAAKELRLDSGEKDGSDE